jgi:hypothetical protein
MSTSFEPTLGSLFGLPLAESPLSTLARALLEVNRKPRNRSEWEARFSFWQKPASETEEMQIASEGRRLWKSGGVRLQLSLRALIFRLRPSC